jgi:hypothetical protein
MARWDWYQATVWQSPETLICEFLVHFELATVVHCRPQNGYHFGVEIRRGDDVLATLFWGGNPGVNVKATGDRSPEVRKLLGQREHFPSRVDACEDWVESGLFDRLATALIMHARNSRVKINMQGDWVRGEGRTLYLGSKSSTVQLVLYEKGYQMGGDLNWVRLEARVMPAKPAAKITVSGWEPEQAFGACKWLTEAMHFIGWDHLKTQSVGTVWRPSDTERQRSALIKQYGRIIREWSHELGGMAQLAAELERLIKQPELV